jgi:DSF synthase
MGAIDFAVNMSQHVINNDHLSFNYESSPANVLWVKMKEEKSKNTLNFSIPLLHELQSLIGTLKIQQCNWLHAGQLKPVHYMVLKSEHPDYFNLGGYLKHFRERIAANDKGGLYHYSKLCLDILSSWAMGAADEITTISLIQGRALGGGFETALCSDYIIAEEQSTFGFPEISFGLFP